jgi:hypothetical protein
MRARYGNRAMQQPNRSPRLILAALAAVILLDVAMLSIYRGLGRLACLVAGDKECLPLCGVEDPHAPPIRCQPLRR